MNNLIFLIILLFGFLIMLAGEIFKLKKEIRKLNRIVKHLLEKNGKKFKSKTNEQFK